MAGDGPTGDEPKREHGDGVVRCTAEDVAELREFQCSGHGGDHRIVDPARFSWLFEQNPCRDGDGDGTGDGRRDEGGLAVWICRRDGEIVGTEGSIACDLKVDEEIYLGSWGIDLFVDPRVRGQGVAAALTEARRRTCRVSCGLGFSTQGYRHARRAGAGDVAAMSVYLHVVDAGCFFTGDVASRTLIRACRPLLGLAARIAARRCAHRSNGIEPVPIDAFDHRADELWHEAAPAYRVVSRRDATRLRWRFDQAPDRDRYLRFYCQDRDRIVGYLVLRAGTWHAQPVLTVVDYFVTPHATSALLATAAVIARRHGATALLCPTLNQRARNTFRSLGFVRLRRASRATRLTVFTRDGDPLVSVVRDPNNWFLTAADSDVD